MDWDVDPRQWNLNVLRRMFNGEENLTLKVGCHVILLRNLDTVTGLCNGTQVSQRGERKQGSTHKLASSGRCCLRLLVGSCLLFPTPVSVSLCLSVSLRMSLSLSVALCLCLSLSPLATFTTFTYHSLQGVVLDFKTYYDITAARNSARPPASPPAENEVRGVGGVLSSPFGESCLHSHNGIIQLLRSDGRLRLFIARWAVVYVGSPPNHSLTWQRYVLSAWKTTSEATRHLSTFQQTSCSPSSSSCPSWVAVTSMSS